MLTEEFFNIDKIVGEYNVDLEPMMYCLNYCFGNHYLETLEKFVEEQGFGGDNIGVFFSSDFEKWDEDYFQVGVMFQWGNIGIIVDYFTFYKYIEKMAQANMELCPDTKEKAIILLNKIKGNYNLSINNGIDNILKKLSFVD